MVSAEHGYDTFGPNVTTPTPSLPMPANTMEDMPLVLVEILLTKPSKKQSKYCIDSYVRS